VGNEIIIHKDLKKKINYFNQISVKGISLLVEAAVGEW
jgi:hypothetical protein